MDQAAGVDDRTVKMRQQRGDAWFDTLMYDEEKKDTPDDWAAQLETDNVRRVVVESLSHVIPDASRPENVFLFSKHPSQSCPTKGNGRQCRELRGQPAQPARPGRQDISK